MLMPAKLWPTKITLFKIVFVRNSADVVYKKIDTELVRQQMGSLAHTCLGSVR
jgi:hypothetical protein